MPTRSKHPVARALPSRRAPDFSRFMRELQAPDNLDLWAHGSRTTLLLRGYDESDPNRLALRGYDPQRQAFVGVSATFDEQESLSVKGHCPECRTAQPLCDHARGLLSSFRSAFQWEWSYLRHGMAVRFLSKPSLQLDEIPPVPGRLQPNPDIFGDVLPPYHVPLAQEAAKWLRAMRDAEPKDDPAESRSYRFPEGVQLRFTMECGAFNAVLVRPVYMAPREPHAKLRLIDLDGETSARSAQILARLTSQERNWLRQLRGWGRPSGSLKAVYSPQTELDQELLSDWLQDGRVDQAQGRASTAIPIPMVLAPEMDLAMHWEVSHALTARLRLGLPPDGRLLPLPRPWWLDASGTRVTPVCGVTTKQLQGLRDAPEIARNQIARFAEALRDAGMPVPVPVPETIPDPEERDVAPGVLVVLDTVDRPDRERVPRPWVTASPEWLLPVLCEPEDEPLELFEVDLLSSSRPLLLSSLVYWFSPFGLLFAMM